MAAERQFVALTVPVLDMDTEAVSVTETVDVREEVVVRETVPELVRDPLKVPEIDDEMLGLPERDAVELTEGVIVGTMVRVKDACGELETLTEAEELRVAPETVGPTLRETVSVRDTVSVSVCVHVRTSVAVEVAVIAVEPEAVLLFVRLVAPVEEVVTELLAVLVGLGLLDSVRLSAGE
jgi:hypothetical protein